jgi:hypothetical protein
LRDHPENFQSRRHLFPLGTPENFPSRRHLFPLRDHPENFLSRCHLFPLKIFKRKSWGFFFRTKETLTPFDRSLRAAMVHLSWFSSESIILSANRVTSHIFENDRFLARYWSMSQKTVGNL